MAVRSNIIRLAFVLSIWFSLSSCLTPPTFTIDLDKPPESRWNEVTKVYGAQIYSFRSQMIKLFKIPKEILALMESQAPALLAYLPREYAGEIVGIAHDIGISVTDMIFVNILYDITAACTSIVAQTSDNKIIHGRNLDYDLADDLRNITIVVNAVRNNETVYTGVTYAGMVGLATGQKPNSFTISLNQRNKGFRIENLYEILLNREAHFVTFEIRRMLETGTDFSSVVWELQTAVLMAPCYIILGGVARGEGVVITRGREAELDIRFIDTSKGTWYVLETNYDWWQPPPSEDDRRDPAVTHMNAVGRSNVSLDALYDVLSTPPVCNRGTTYTALMSAAKPEAIRAVIRKGDTPCK